MIETEYNILMRQVELLKEENEKLRKVADVAGSLGCDESHAGYDLCVDSEGHQKLRKALLELEV